MREIPLTNKDKTTKVDSDMFDYLTQWSWFLGSGGYAIRWKEGTTRKDLKPKLVFMHREVIGTPKGKITDHINGDKLDNRMKNLRICNHKQNNSNTKMFTTNKSGYRGVSWNSVAKKWLAYVSYDSKNYYLGSFKSKHKAAKAWNKAAKELKGEFAVLNKIKE